jgi:hypothetical protein
MCKKAVIPGLVQSFATYTPIDLAKRLRGACVHGNFPYTLLQGCRRRAAKRQTKRFQSGLETHDLRHKTCYAP